MTRRRRRRISSSAFRRHRGCDFGTTLPGRALIAACNCSGGRIRQRNRRSSVICAQQAGLAHRSRCDGVETSQLRGNNRMMEKYSATCRVDCARAHGSRKHESLAAQQTSAMFRASVCDQRSLGVMVLCCEGKGADLSGAAPFSVCASGCVCRCASRTMIALCHRDIFYRPKVADQIGIDNRGSLKALIHHAGRTPTGDSARSRHKKRAPEGALVNFNRMMMCPPKP